MFQWIIKHAAEIEAIGKLVAYIGTSGALLVGGYKKVYKPCSEFFKRLMKGLAELEPNGGGSIKDMTRNTQTSVRNMEKDLKIMKATQEAEFQLNPDCKFECSPDGRCIKVNDALCRLFGATDRQQLYGFGWLHFIKESEREYARETWENGVETDNVISSYYTLVSGVTGLEIKCSYVAYVKRDKDNNEIINIFGIVTKI